MQALSTATAGSTVSGACYDSGMSTKIHNAFKIPRVESTAELFTFLDTDFRDTLNETRDQLDAEALVKSAIRLLDNTAVNNALSEDTINDSPDDEHLSPIEQALHSWRNEQNDEKPGSIFHDPHSFSASIAYSEREQCVLLIAHHSREAYNDALSSLGLVDWHYQDQSDKPEDISDAEWEQRRVSWNDVLSGSGVPARSMLVFTLRSEYDSVRDLASLARREHANENTALHSDSAVHPAVRAAYSALTTGDGRKQRAHDAAGQFSGRFMFRRIGGHAFIEYKMSAAGEEDEQQIADILEPVLPRPALADLWEDSLTADPSANDADEWERAVAEAYAIIEDRMRKMLPGDEETRS